MMLLLIELYNYIIRCTCTYNVTINRTLQLHCTCTCTYDVTINRTVQLHYTLYMYL